MVATKSGTEKYVLMNDKKTWSKVTVDSGSGGGGSIPEGNHYIYDGGGVAGY